MRLPDYILAHTDLILAEWDTFARSIWPVSNVSFEKVRDHAEAILRAAAGDMKSSQTTFEQSQKSKGRSEADAVGGKINHASGEHALGRASSGFDLRTMMAEYRALRASVVRLWSESIPEPNHNDLADLTRFHEAMDQSLTKAVTQFSEHLDKSQQMFLRILGHDLRVPLNAIAMMAHSLAETRPDDTEAAEIASHIRSSTDASAQMLNDFLDFAASRLGQPMPMTRAPMDLAALCAEVVAEIRVTSPTCRWQLEVPRELRGEWDHARLRQLLSNLISNAVQHGDPTSGVTVITAEEGSQVRLSIHNHGSPIPPECLPQIFDPFVRGPNRGEHAGSLGLGLYIAREVANGHRGTLEVTSALAAGTTFTVLLPASHPKTP